MRWKGALRAGLERATGYTLVRADRPGTQAPPRRRRRRSHLDAEARETIRSVKARTMTAPEKLYGLILATRYVVDHGIPGSIVECGVWRGGSMQAVARTLLARGVTDRDLHLFDTFEGMPPPTERDRRPDGKLAAELLATRAKTRKVWAVASLDDVRAGMAETRYPAARVHFHRGLVEDTVPAEAPERIAILRLDTDWYESTRHELEHLYDRVPSGGVLIFDDYGFWQGARQAIDEFLDRTGERLLLLPMASGRITVKP
jgi:O-methyltransferase